MRNQLFAHLIILTLSLLFVGCGPSGGSESTFTPPQPRPRPVVVQVVETDEFVIRSFKLNNSVLQYGENEMLDIEVEAKEGFLLLDLDMFELIQMDPQLKMNESLWIDGYKILDENDLAYTNLSGQGRIFRKTVFGALHGIFLDKVEFQAGQKRRFRFVQNMLFVPSNTRYVTDLKGLTIQKGHRQTVRVVQTSPKIQGQARSS